MGSIGSFQNSFQFRLRPTERRVILLLGDAVMAGFALFVSLYAWNQIDWLDFKAFLEQRVPGWFYLLPLCWLVLNVEMYDVRRAGRRGETVKGVALSATASFILYLFIFFFSDDPLPRRGVATFIVAASVLMILWRMIYIRVFTASEFMRRVLIVGAGRAGSTLIQVFKEMWPPPFYLVGLIDDDPRKCGELIEGFPVLGTSRDLITVIEREKISDLIFAITGEMCDDMFQALLKAEEEGTEVTTMPMVYEDLLGRVPIFLLRSDWILRSFVDEARVDVLYELAKRSLDMLGGFLGVLGILVLFPFIGLAIFLESGWPIFYTQGRLGKNGREYQIFKFRTMRELYNGDGKLLPDKDRVTRIGKVLRKSHLDELPQFVNVLRGEMSLVGPRAEISELVDELELQVPFYRARLLVKPGITGWAQVNFGYASTVEETAVKLEYDLYYIKHRTLMLDFVILLRTVGTVVGFRGQ